MDKSKTTHKKCSIAVQARRERYFEFLVPNHLVDENGNIDKKIIQEVRDKFEVEEQLDFDDCEEGSWTEEYSFYRIPKSPETRSEPTEILGDCSLFDEEIQDHQIFGDEK